MRSAAGRTSDAVSNGASFDFHALPAWHFDNTWAKWGTHCNQSEVQCHHYYNKPPVVAGMQASAMSFTSIRQLAAI